MNTEINTQDQDNIDIKKYIYKIIEHWYLFVITIFISLSVAYYINQYSDPIFQVNGTLLIQAKDNALVSGVEGIVEEFGLFRKTRRKEVINEIGILKSYSLINQTIKELNFNISYFSIGRIRSPEKYKSVPFYVELDTNFEQTYSYPVYITLLNNREYRVTLEDKNISKTLFYGQTFNEGGFKFKVFLDEINYFNDPKLGYKFYFIINNINSLTNRYRAKLDIAQTDKKSTILNITSNGTVALKEVDFINKLMEVYIRRGLEEQNKIAKNTVEFIDKQLNNILDSLQTAENTLQNFRLNNKVIDLSVEGSTLFKQTEELQADKANALIKKQYYEYLLNYLQEKTDYSDIIAPSIIGIGDQLLNSLVSQLSSLSAEKKIMTFTANEKNPSINVITLKIENTRQALIENIKNVISSNEIILKGINERIAQAEIQIRKLPITERQLLSIKRKFDLSDNIYTFFLQKRAEAGIAQATNISDSKILDLARADNAKLISPNVSLNYTIAFLIAILIPIMFVILKDFFNDRIIDRSDVEAYTKVPIIGVIGHNTKQTDISVYENPKSAISESFRTLRTNLQYMLVEKEHRVIAITSLTSSEGKTFCTANLGSIIAMSDKKTLIIGLDLRKPKVHKDFNIENTIGLSTYLINKNQFSEIIFPTYIDNLFIAPAGPVPPNPAELIETKRMKQFIEQAKVEFDYVLIDTPPIAIVTDALLIAGYTDLNIIILRQNYSSKSAIQLINELYDKRQIKNLAILINDITTPGYYGYKNYNYGYYYNYGYGSGYTTESYYEEDFRPTKWYEKILGSYKKNI